MARHLFRLSGIVVLIVLVIVILPELAAKGNGRAPTTIVTDPPAVAQTTAVPPTTVPLAVIHSTAVPPTPQPETAGPSTRLTPAQSAAGDSFGQAIAVDGNTAVIGAPQANNSQGAVTIFTRQGSQWRETARLTASDGAANDNFGRSVAVSGQTILVGASGHSAAGWQAGAVYVFEFSNGRWQETAKLLPASAQDIRFGWSVALAGDTAVVGAPYRYQGEMLNVGAVTIFNRQGQEWRQQIRLTTGQGGGMVGSDLFGWAVAAQGNTIAVGAYLDGAVYVYELANEQWRQTAVLRDNTPGTHFGYSVALTADKLLVGAPAAGAPAADNPVQRAGTAVLFTYQPGGSWTEAARLAPGNLRPGSRFGWSVALTSNLVAVGMRESDGRTDVEESGGTAAFRISNGQPTHIVEFYAPQPAPFAHLGTAVAVSGNTVFTGAPGHENSPGTVYAFTLAEK